ncbi:hypothetical protein [Desulforhabdus sp. TSK]|uniref:hypothetical protein n=1 Tax=Desulforhabdus sp. TSK TaxID=2925014 RepID=UPI001FC8DEA0|nr:hypothetical protein [Desulforhabdus sp. TSK]GKT09149.1 hypothetical protein DSTSK_24540 [Desulforhabdus sp. TSK]
MSGEKDSYVNLRQSEYNRMMNSCNRLDNVERNVKSGMERLSGDLRSELNDRMSSMNKRYENMERHISGMSEEMRRVEREQNRRLQEQAAEFRRSMETLSDTMIEQREEYLSLIREQGESFTRAMQMQRRDLEGQIKNIQDALDRKETSQRDQASQWLEDVRRCMNMIESEYRHDKFKPGALDRLRSELILSEGNFKQGNFQSAIASAQQTFLRASELRIELERLEMEWEAHLEMAKRSAAEVLADCDAQEACRFAFETDDGSEEVAGEIDFWTEGGLSQLRKRAQKELQRLGQSENLSLDDLKKSVAHCEQWRQEGMGLAEKAKEALIASQLRNNIGQTIETALQQAGWRIADAAYEAEDFRRAVHVKLQNPQGDEIVTIITPNSGPHDTIQNRLGVHFFDRSTNDESFRQERLKALMGVLEEEGLECSNPVCRPGTEGKSCENSSLLDFDRVRRAQPTSPGSGTSRS